MNATVAAWSAAVTLAVTGAITGVYYAFSVAVMPGLNAADAGTAIRAMTSINQRIQNPLFFVTFFGPIVAATVTGVLLLILGTGRPVCCSWWLRGLPGGRVHPDGGRQRADERDARRRRRTGRPAQAARVWADYSSGWTWWNSVRAGASLASLLLAGLGVYVWVCPDDVGVRRGPRPTAHVTCCCQTAGTSRSAQHPGSCCLRSP
ncbi:hypothetical protein NKG94_22190 [Micromonospora sp. M12]